MQIIDAIKNLIVAMGGADEASDITSDQIAETIQYLADNWETISASIGGGGSYILPAATASTLGGVKEAATVEAVSAADASTAIAATYTQAEVQAIATLANANKTAINAILTNLKAAGIMA